MYTWGELVALYRLTLPARNLPPRYNIAPTTAICLAISLRRSAVMLSARFFPPLRPSS
jgi:hypothetical protein